MIHTVSGHLNRSYRSVQSSLQLSGDPSHMSPSIEVYPTVSDIHTLRHADRAFISGSRIPRGCGGSGGGGMAVFFPFDGELPVPVAGEGGAFAADDSFRGVEGRGFGAIEQGFDCY